LNFFGYAPYQARSRHRNARKVAGVVISLSLVWAGFSLTTSATAGDSTKSQASKEVASEASGAVIGALGTEFSTTTVAPTTTVVPATIAPRDFVEAEKTEQVAQRRTLSWSASSEVRCSYEVGNEKVSCSTVEAESSDSVKEAPADNEPVESESEPEEGSDATDKGEESGAADEPSTGAASSGKPGSQDAPTTTTTSAPVAEPAPRQVAVAPSTTQAPAPRLAPTTTTTTTSAPAAPAGDSQPPAGEDEVVSSPEVAGPDAAEAAYAAPALDPSSDSSSGAFSAVVSVGMVGLIAAAALAIAASRLFAVGGPRRFSLRRRSGADNDLAPKG
jgi:hypothetical protein